MNPKLLFAHFERISDAPDITPRLRRFILQLAVRGRLVEQDAQENLSPELCDLREQGPAEKHEHLPQNWVRARMNKLVSLEYGKALPEGCLEQMGRVPVFGSNGVVGYSSKALTENPAIIIGRKGSAGAVSLCDGPSWTKDVAYFVEPPSFFDIKYLYFALQTLDLDQLGKGVKPGLSRSDAYQLDLSVPPLREQQRIVAKVDQLMVLCDEFEKARKERERQRNRLAASALHHLGNGADKETLREHARFYLSQFARLTVRSEEIPALRQTILNLALRGQLTAQDPRDEPALEILKKIDAERMRLIEASEAKEQKQVRMTPRDAIPFDVPDGWCWASLGRIAYGFRYGTSVKCAYERTGEPVLRIPNIQNGRITTEDLKFGPLSKREAEDLRLQLGDILMVRSNGSLDLVGRAALVEADTVGYCYAGYLVRVRTSIKYLDTRYLLLALSTTHIRNQIEIPIRTTVGLKNVNATELSSLAIPLAPLAEQHRIVVKVDELMALCDRLEGQLENTQSESRHLLEAILDQALNDNRDESDAVEKSYG